MSTTEGLAYQRLSKMLKNPAVETICDYGCGDGKLLSQLAKKFPQKSFLGVDTFSQWSPDKVPKDDENIRFVDRFSKSFEELAQNERFDIISTVCTVHHFTLPITEVRLLEALLHPQKGKLLLIDFAFSNNKEGERVKNLLSYTSEMTSAFIGGHHRHHYKLDELKDLLSATTLVIEEAQLVNEPATDEELIDAKERARKHVARIKRRISEIKDGKAIQRCLNRLLEENSHLIEELPVDYSSILIVLASVPFNQLRSS